MQSLSAAGEVLLIDENDQWREKVAELLDISGHRVWTVSNKQAALNRLAEMLFDVIIIDVELPSARGLGLVSKIRECAPQSRIITVTSNPNVTTAVEALRLGVLDYLCKPVDLDRLLLVVREAVDGSLLRQSGHSTPIPGHKPIDTRTPIPSSRSGSGRFARNGAALAATEIAQESMDLAPDSRSALKVQFFRRATDGPDAALRDASGGGGLHLSQARQVKMEKAAGGSNSGLRRKDPSATLLGDSEAMKHVRQQIETIAPHSITVLIQGETGTGKDLVANLLHSLSPRATRSELCKVNCPSIPENLFESEMFGYEAGAFTGAQRRRLGRFELAHHGTIFLDEISSLPLTMQAKLLEVLEYKRFYRVGGTEKLEVDVRVIAATNVPLEGPSSAGQFRQDLFYRLRVCTIELPPLRNRTEDIPLLADFMLHDFAQKYNQPLRKLPAETMGLLMAYPWPGNVRELGGLLARYAVQDDLSIFDGFNVRISEGTPEARDVLALNEVQMLKTALTATGWNQREAAKMLRISYSALRRRLQKYNIVRNSFL